MSTVSGAYGVGDPPVPIPNTEVKTHCGNNTWTTRSWQDSTAPDSIHTKALRYTPEGFRRLTQTRNLYGTEGNRNTKGCNGPHGDPPPSAAPNTEASI